MTDDPLTDMSLWRDYERGAVGIQIEGQPRRLLFPEAARKKADEMEQSLVVLPTDQQEQAREIVERIRQFADEVENA